MRQMHNDHVSVMRAFGKQVHDRLVSFLHQVVYNQQNRLATVKVVPIRKRLVKDDSGISGKHLLVLSATVHYLVRRWIYHFRHVVDEPKYEHGLAARRRSGDDGRKLTNTKTNENEKKR